MNIEDLVRSSVNDLARGVAPPPSDLVALQARAGRTRRLRVAAVGAAAIALVAAVAFGTWALQDSDGPEPAGPQSSSFPVWKDVGADTAHVGDDTMNVAREVGAPGLTATGLVYVDGAGTAYSQRFDGEPVEIGEDAGAGVVGDPDGRLAAWIDESGIFPVLVVYDVDAGSERARIDLGSVDVQAKESMVSSLPSILSVDEKEIAYLADDHLWLADPSSGEDPRETSLSANDVVDVDEGVRAVSAPSGKTVQFVAAGGQVVTPSSPMESDGQLSSDGKWFWGFERGTGAVAVADTATGEVRLLDLGGKFGFTGAWAYGDTLMVLAQDLLGSANEYSGSVLSCQVSTLECDTRATSPNFLTLALPIL
ncbi:MAG: hypothetical protein WKF72_02535 [Nocardioidaceae bacterium]